MKQALNPVTLFSAVILLSLQACTCGDPALVRIPDADASAPKLTWIVTVLSQTPSGPISALTPYDAPENNITVKRTDEVTVQLVGLDEESGIKKISMKGGFGITCTTGTGALSMDGIVPETSQDLSFLTVCALKEWKLPRTTIDVGLTCAAGATFSSGGYGLTGKADNMKSGTTTSTLNINITP